jgi:hypothetical protein
VSLTAFPIGFEAGWPLLLDGAGSPVEALHPAPKSAVERAKPSIFFDKLNEFNKN